MPVQIGFFALIAVEALTGQGFLQTLGIQVRCCSTLSAERPALLMHLYIS